MRDPLSRVRIRHKLPLTFLAVCLVAFGVGGVVLTTEARSALEAQIAARLDERASAVHVVVERHLDLHKRRSEDFASDGFIRAEFAHLLEARREGRPAEEARIAEALQRHLLENKLPIVSAFVGALLCAPDGRPCLVVPAGTPTRPPLAPLTETVVGPLEAASPGHPYGTFRITTPLRHQSEKVTIGALQLVVRADTWVAGMAELADLPPMERDAMWIRGETGTHLDLGGATGASPLATEAGNAFEFVRPVAQTGWALELRVDRAAALAPAVHLRNQYLLIGLALLLVTAGVLFFPVRFLLQPLSAIAEAARRIAEGDFRARVTHESGDEIGDLARGFNVMAAAVEDRTGALERTADALGRREQDVRLERDRLNAVIRSMRDGLFILDADAEVTLSNAAARPVLAALREHRDQVPPPTCAQEHDPSESCLQCLAHGDCARQSCVIERDGRTYEVSMNRLPAAPGARPQRLCVSRDVTERMAAQEGQAHQERMSVLGEVAAVMAHELNNPLAAISMFSQMLQEQLEPGSSLHESADVIRRNVANCKKTIASLLDLAARGSFESAPVEVGPLLEDVVRLLKPIYERAGVELTMSLDAEDGEVLGDEVQLRQVFINLVMNAIQALPAGGHIALASTEADGELTVRVRDDGPGIEPALRDRVFEPFFTTKGAGVGTGLGLSTSRRIVDEHGGSLDLEATGPAGTTFAVRLPRKRMQRARARREEPGAEVPRA